MITGEGKYGFGWLPDLPDFRDYTETHNAISDRLKNLGQKPLKTMMEEVGVLETKGRKSPTSVDLRHDCPPIEDQQNLGSCTANAGVALLEYYEKRASNRFIDASRLFLYKATRNLMKVTGDTGAYIRMTMGAMVLFGVPPEEYWPYSIADFETEPPAFCYAFAQNYQALSYYRLDPPNLSRGDLLVKIKRYLAHRLPAMFGFTVYSSIGEGGQSGEIPYPHTGDRRSGGHAVVAVGYDDDKKITHSNPDAKPTKGALLIRNSWGFDWGVDGYGWLPYEYVLKGLAIDWWSLARSEWIDTGKFGLIEEEN